MQKLISYSKNSKENAYKISACSSEKNMMLYIQKQLKNFPV